MPSNEIDASFFLANQGLVNFSNSLLSHFGVKPFHETLPSADKALKGHKKVCVFLFDAMGEYILQKWPKVGSYFLDNKIDSIYSTNPATTVAATDAFLSGRYPIETGYLGWSLYFQDRKQAVDVFPNRDSLTHEDIPGDNLIKKACPYKDIAELMREQGIKAKVSYEYPINGKDGPKFLFQMKKQANDFFQKQGGQFLYSYWTKPDSLLHAFGVNSFIVKQYLKSIKRMVASFVKQNPDVAVFVIADHGQINVEYEDIFSTSPELESLLSGPMVLEGRTPSFFVESKNRKRFEQLFEENFKGRAVLMSKEDAFDSHYFGFGKPHPMSSSFIGDYVALMLDDHVLYDSRQKKNPHFLKGHHAGGKIEERLICLSGFNI